MNDFADLATRVDATRRDLLKREADDRDRRAGLTKLRPAIDHLQAVARPALEAARAALMPSGLSIEIGEGWQGNPKHAELDIVCTAIGHWPSNVGTPRGARVFVRSDGETLTLRRRPFHQRDDAEAVLVAIGEGDAVETAVGEAVETFLDAVEGAMAGSVMRGAELRVAER